MRLVVLFFNKFDLPSIEDELEEFSFKSRLEEIERGVESLSMVFEMSCNFSPVLNKI